MSPVVRPPALARALLRLLVPADDRDFVLADLDARHRRLKAERGGWAARRWYWSQVVRSLPTLVTDAARDAGSVGLNGASGEVRIVARTALSRPLYAVGVSGTLAIGLASITVLGTLAWGIWLSPLPILEPDGVVRIYELGRVSEESGERPRNRVSPPLIEDLRENDFDAISAVSGMSLDSPEWTLNGDRTQLQALRVSPEFFEILGLRPLAGSLNWGADPSVVVLSSRLWEERFGSDPAVVGRTMELNGVLHRIAGVTALADGYPGHRDILLPLQIDEDQRTEGMRGARYLEAIARVAPGADVTAASNELAAFVAGLAPDHPQHVGWSAEAIGLADDLTAPFRPVLALLLAAGIAFLVLAVVNVVGLVSARRMEQRHEQAVRRALGASSGRLVRDAVVEAGVLGLLGSVAGIGAGLVILPRVVASLPSDLPRVGTVSIDSSVALTLLGMGVIVSLVVGVAGHLITGSAPLGSSRGASAGLGGRRLLVAGQVSLTTLLLGSSLIMMREAMAMRSVDLGFDPGNVEAGMVFLPSVGYPDPASRLMLWQGLLAGLEEDGVRAAYATNPSMAGGAMNYGFLPEGATEEVFGQYHTVTGAYFDLLSIDVAAGRSFLPGEEGAVIVINQAVADAHFADTDPIGRVIRMLNVDRRIVGVVSSTHHFGPDQPAPFEVYVPVAEDPWSFGHLLIESSPGAAERVANVLASLDPALAPPALAPFSGFVSEWFAPLRLQLLVIVLLSMIGAALAGLGLYAVVAWHVRAQKREIGIRLALGAPSTGVFGRVVGQGVLLAAGGALAGFGLWVLSWERVAEVLAVGRGPSLGMAAAVGGLVIALAVLACLVPALRSTRVDPMESLRAE